MQIIPAIDIRGGNCVRLFQGKFSEETVYSSDPVSMALKFEKEGAARIHIVDLDGACSGRMENEDIIGSIASGVSVPVQVGGGIRDEKIADSLLSKGVSKVIMGTAAVCNRKLLKKVVKKWPGRVSVGIDSSGGRVATSGWKELSSEKAHKLAAEMEKEGVGEIIVTDIKRDGTLKGPSLNQIRKIAGAVNIPVIASGGVGSLDDIASVKKLGIKNLWGIIVGKAIYSGAFSLEEAIRVAK